MALIEERRHRLRIPGLPELTGVGHGHHRRADRFQPHRHLDGLELVYLVRGHLRLWAGGDRYELQGGDCSITRPLEPHGSEDDRLQPCELYWLTIEPPRKTPWFGLPKAEAATLASAVDGLPRSFHGHPDQLEDFARLVALVQETPSPSRHLRIRSALLHLLLRTIDRASAGVQPGISAPIRAAQKLMQTHLDRPPGLDQLAAAAGLKRSRFCTRFRTEVGVTPAQYGRRLRVGAALEAIASSRRPLAAIALDFGFASSQHLAEQVRKETGRTPSTFRSPS